MATFMDAKHLQLYTFGAISNHIARKKLVISLDIGFQIKTYSQIFTMEVIFVFQYHTLPIKKILWNHLIPA